MFDTNALSAPLADKVQALVKVFRQHPFLAVWDNFDVVSGIAGTSLEPAMSAHDRAWLGKLPEG